MRATLGQRNFALLWFAGLISLVGDRALLAALPFFVYSQTGSSLATAMLFTAYYIPMILLGSIAGVFADLWDRRRIMVVTNVAQAVLLPLLLLVRSEEWLWLVYVVFFLETSLSMFFQPAETALLPALVPADRLLSANALNALNDNLARLIGPVVGGVLLSASGLWGIVLIDSASFFVAAVLIWRITTSATHAVTPAAAARKVASSWRHVWNEWLAGLRLARTDRLVASLLLVVAIMSFGGAMFDPLLAPFVQSVLHREADSFGWFLTAGAVGGIIGSVSLGQFGQSFRASRIFGLGNIIGGALLFAVYSQTEFPLVLALEVAAGAALVGSGTGLLTLMQWLVPDRFRGRLSGGVSTTGALVGLAGIWIAGALADVFGVVAMLQLAAAITVAAGGLGLLLFSKAEGVDRSEVAVKHEASSSS
jgi:MFS family permease